MGSYHVSLRLSVNFMPVKNIFAFIAVAFSVLTDSVGWASGRASNL